jgi:hypothetical protein
MQSWEGSKVPLLQREIDFCQSITECFKSFKFLNHRKFMEDKISGLRDEMLGEKKQNFTENF